MLRLFAQLLGHNGLGCRNLADSLPRELAHLFSHIESFLARSHRGTFLSRDSNGAVRESFTYLRAVVRAPPLHDCRGSEQVVKPQLQYSRSGYHKIRYVMKKLLLLPLMAMGLLFSQFEAGRREPPSDERHPAKLPNGKSQQEEILKADHEKTLQDAAQLVKLSEELQDELIKEDRHVLSIATLKKTEDIEKLAKRIRTRLKK